jgi:hypothetical protein
MSSLWAVQVALVARWKDTAAVTALVGTRIYDGAAPANAVAPYVVVGSKTEAQRRTMARAGFANTVTSHIWSDYNGDKEALAILEAMNDALVSPLVLEGFGAARLKPEFTETLVDRTGDSPLRHVPVRYRIRTQKAA